MSTKAMKRIHQLYEGIVPFDHRKKYRAVPCATLGTNWRDIEDEDGNTFAIQVSAPIAKAFVKESWKYGNVFQCIPLLRRMALENEHMCLYGQKPKRKRK